MATVPTITLSNGKEMPVIGLGTWKSKENTAQAVKDAIDAGYYHIDGALACRNESAIGTAIQEKLHEGVVKREDLFVVAKLWSTFNRPDLVPVGIKKSLENLQLEYVDLYLIHLPMAFKEEGDLMPMKFGKTLYSDVDYLDTWKAMEEIHRQGLTKAIGLCNFNSEQLRRILDNCTVKPAVIQVECHPYFTQRKLVRFCEQKGIPVAGYSPFGSPNNSWVKPEEPKLLEDPKILKIGDKYEKSPAQVILRWQIQRGLIVVPMSTNKEHIQENISIFDFQLDETDMDIMNSLNYNNRRIGLEWSSDHKHYPFKAKF